ncbi:MAG: chemoreceptor glutamine deamidase CheD [Nitrosomonadales bacterium]|nr:chemoreceptor glutamine deamidase CheD [Nitrosomonadales bacterium]
MPTPPNKPLPLPGFEHIKRAWNEVYAAYAARLNPGEYYVTRNDECIYTTLGSCISACIRDRVSGVGGMNHFMLPAVPGDAGLKSEDVSYATRYGNFAMEHMINEILKNGGYRKNLEVKLFGGGRIIAGMTDVGKRNIEFVRKYIAIEGLQVTSEDVGDTVPRMVVYFPSTGKVRVKRLRSLHNNIVVDMESSYQRQIVEKPESGEVELF